jgi:hypothetical protein
MQGRRWLVPILLLEDLDMGYFSAFLSRSRVAFDRFRSSLNRQSRRFFSERRFSSRFDGTKAYVKKRLWQLYRKLRSLRSKVAAKTAASSQ